MASATTLQLRALHAIARKRGLDHDALRAAAGVPSLKLLTIEQAGRLIDQWQQQYPEQGRADRRPARRPRAKSGIYKFSSDSQRRGIERRLKIIGWPDVKFDSPKAPKFEFTDWRCPHRTSRDLSRIITWLDQVIANNANSAGRKDATAHPHTEVPARAPF